jgi:hypothetical protein
MNLLLRAKLLTLSGVLALGGLIGSAPPAAHAFAQAPIAPIGASQPALSGGNSGSSSISSTSGQSVIVGSTTSGQAATQPAATTFATSSDVPPPRPTLLVAVDTAAADSPLVWTISGRNFPPDHALLLFGYTCQVAASPSSGGACDPSILFRVGQSSTCGGCPQEFVSATASSGAGSFATNVDLAQARGRAGLVCGEPVWVTAGTIELGALATVETPLCGGPESSPTVVGLIPAPGSGGLSQISVGSGTGGAGQTTLPSTGGAGASGGGGPAPRVHAAE